MSEAITIDNEVLRGMPLPQYSDESSKADYGKLLVIAGSARLPGAALLAARAALRSGCGTVRVAAPKCVATAIGVAMPELMVLPLPETAEGTLSLKALPMIKEQFGPCDAVVLGPGLDDNDETNKLIRQLAASIPLPTIIDAQALLALGSEDYTTHAAARVLTPHEGELEPILGMPFKETGVTSEEFAPTFAAKEGCTLVFKGRETLIASPGRDLWKNTAGTRGMGTAGSGDVLSGIIGAFLAQGLEPWHAATWGVHVHALAGEAAGKDLGDDGMLATDFLERIPRVLHYLRGATSAEKSAARTGLRPMN